MTERVYDTPHGPMTVQQAIDLLDYGVPTAAPPTLPEHDATPRHARPVRKFNGIEARGLFGPVVYIWEDAAGVVQYVGMSRNGLSRVFASGHCIREMQPDDELRVYWCQSAEDAATLEIDLIRKLRPVRNRMWVPLVKRP